MPRRNKLTVYLFAVISIFAAGLTLSSNPTYARTESENSITKKAILQGVSYCYTTGGIEDSLDLNEFHNFVDDAIKDSSPYKDWDYVALPSGLTMVDDNNVDCKALFAGASGFKGVFSIFGKKYKEFGNDPDHEAKRSLLTGMGYTKQETSGNCITFDYDHVYYKTWPQKDETYKGRYTKNVCVKNGKFETQDYSTEGTVKDTVPINFELSSDNGTIDKITIKEPYLSKKLRGDAMGDAGGGVGRYLDLTVEGDDFKEIDASSSNWQTELKQLISTYFVKVEDATGYYDFSREVINGEGDTSYDIVPLEGQTNKYSLAADTAIKYLSGYDGRHNIRFTEAEQLSYYIQVIIEWFYDGNKEYDKYWVCDKSDWSLYGTFTLEVKRSHGGNKGVCRIDPSAKKRSDAAYGFDPTVVEAKGSKTRAFDASGNVKLTLEEVIAKINELSDSMEEDIPDLSEDSEEPSETTETTCQNSGGAGSLGWIVCSILDWMANATEDLYTGVVKPALNVEPELFNGDGDNTAEAAWNVFRNFANIIFTILVLFVIFSQLTGVGIDNYGIKKILPKLIVTAVLINLSYFICLVCVDLSNIVGNGVQQLFNNMSSISQELNIKTIDGAETPEDASNKISVNVDGKNTSSNSSASGVGITAVTVAGAAIGVYAIYSNPALLLTLFISVLGVLISILFVFILLAGRKAAIILLTVISPIAFIMYMLPNTKKIFDKWFNLWKAMLLVYPICGLLIGGGNFASQLMLNIGDTSNAVTAFTAMIVGIVPIFFIPTVIKNAYAALGSMGGAIAGFGNRLRGGATSGMRNSRLNQNAQKRSQDRSQRISAMRRAGVRLDKDGNVVESNRPTASLRRKMSGTWVGRRLGLEASMGQGAAEFTKLEAARRGNMAAGNNTNAMNATLAGLAEKESAQRVSDQEVLMRAGKVELDGKKLNVDNAKQMEDYHYQMLKKASEKKAAGDMASYSSYMDKVRAAQNIMAKTDTGRGSMQQNYQEAIRQGYTGGLSEAASHLMGAHSSDIKAANRAMHSLTQDLAQGVNMESIQNNIASNAYDINSISGYTAQSLASADDGALDGLKESIAAINSMTDENGHNEKRDQLNTLIEETLNNKNIQSQPKVEAKLRQIRDDLNRPSGGPYGYDGGGI